MADFKLSLFNQDKPVLPFELGWGHLNGWNEKDRKYTVEYKGTAYLGVMLMDSPQNGDGSVAMFIPSSYYKSQCLVLKYQGDNTIYILGFPQLTGFVAASSVKKEVPVSPGTRVIRGEQPDSYIAMFKTGLIDIVSSLYASLRMDPVLNMLTLEIDNVKMFFSKGATKLVNSLTDRVNKVVLTVKKSYEDIAAVKFENVEMSVGDHETDGTHLIGATFSQDYIATAPQHVQKWKLGKQAGGNILELASSNETAQTTVALSINGTTGELKYAGKVNDITTCELTITPSGDIKLLTSKADAKIIIGGEGKEQPLVTKAWLDNVYAKHLHSSSTGPTTAPLPLVLPPTTADAVTNVVTHTLRAE